MLKPTKYRIDFTHPLRMLFELTERYSMGHKFEKNIYILQNELVVTFFFFFFVKGGGGCGGGCGRVRGVSLSNWLKILHKASLTP
jgi:hypothetical protein